jgi:protein-disulfide isomerase
MPECGFCGEEFDSERQLHLHWGEEHVEELDSNQEEKVEDARHEEENEKEESRRKKDLAFKTLATLLTLAVAALVIPQLLSIDTGEPTGTVSLNLSDQPMKGSPDAEVTIVEFGDYYCPSCKAFKDTVMPKLQENYLQTGEAKFYYLDFPLRIHEPYAMKASMAAQCVYQQDSEKFWEYHDALYENQRKIQYNVESLTGLAENNTDGLDYDKLENCIRNRETFDDVRKDVQIGNNANVSRTPMIYVNGVEASSIRYSKLKSMIESELEE